MAENEKVPIDKLLLLEARVFVATEYYPPEENYIYFQTSLPTEEDYEKDSDVFYQEITPEDVELEPSFSEKLFHLIKKKTFLKLNVIKMLILIENYFLKSEVIKKLSVKFQGCSTLYTYRTLLGMKFF